jgi:hypothetical protein
MEHSLRPYVTAGVVLAGASLIGAAPLGPAAVQIQTRAVQLTAVDALAADVVSAVAAPQEFPISTLADVFTNAFANLQSLGSEFTSNPTPIITALMENQLIYSNDLATAAETAGTNLVNALQDFPTVISNAMSDLASGDFFDAQTSITQFLTQAPLSVLQPLDNGFFEVAQSMSNNLENLFSTPDYYANADSLSDVSLSSSIPQWFSELVQAQLLAPHAAELAFAGVGQDIVTAMQDGDSTAAFNDVVNAPATILDAYLNGYNLGDDSGGGGIATMLDAVPEAMRNVSAQGLLSEEGTVATMREAMETIARAISPAKEELGPIADAAGASAGGADLNTVVGDLSTLLSPDTALGELATAFDPNAVADISSLLTADLAPNASGWVVDLFGLF